MKTPFSKLSALTLTLALGLAAAGCDHGDTHEPTDRSARVVMELDGEHVRTWEVAEPLEVQADLVVWEQVAPTPDSCEDDEVPFALVLEQGGDALLEHEGCAPAEGVGASTAADALTAAPDVQANFWCDSCALTDDCFDCCRCAGGKAVQCAIACYG